MDLSVSACALLEVIIIIDEAVLGNLDENLTKHFYQYAVVKQSAADKGLRYQERYEFKCEHIPAGKDAISVEDYVRGQGKDQHAFLKYVKQLQAVNVG